MKVAYSGDSDLKLQSSKGYIDRIYFHGDLLMWQIGAYCASLANQVDLSIGLLKSPQNAVAIQERKSRSSSDFYYLIWKSHLATLATFYLLEGMLVNLCVNLSHICFVKVFGVCL